MIYFDNAATTKPSDNAMEEAQKFYNQCYFNPSALYKEGLNVSRYIKSAKETILSVLGARNHDVIFTSCGSESNNTAIFGSVNKCVFVTDKGEHASVNACFLDKKNNGEKVEFIDLLPDGCIDTTKLYEYVKNNRVDFVSLIHVNNETGAINDVNKICENLKKLNPKILIHVDGVQSFGKIVFTLSEYIDYYSISAHKINGLKGVGALIKRKNAKLSPLVLGGGQENGLRSGTENVYGIKVFDIVTKEHYNNIKRNYDYVKELNEIVKEGLNKDIFTIISSKACSPYILSVSAVGLRGEVIMHTLEEKGILVGNGSACSSKNRFSRVIEACGYDNKVLDGVLRISFSPDNTAEETEYLVTQLNEIALKLKGIMKI